MGICISFNITAHLLLKYSALLSGAADRSTSSYASPAFIAAAVSFASSLLVYQVVLKRLALNVAFPLLNSLAYIGVALLAGLLFGEKLSWCQWSGMALIIVGLLLLKL